MLRRTLLLALILTASCDQNPTTPSPAATRASESPGFLALPVNDAVWSMAYGVSETGWAAGEVDLTDTDWHAARWRITTSGGTATATLQDLGNLNGRATIAFDVNGRGDVVGGSMELATGIGAGPDEAFVYRNNAMQALPTLGGANSFARRINNLGWIAGQSETADGESHATVWRPKRIGTGYDVIDLGTLGGSFSWCNTIDDYGRVVGLSETASGAIVAWRWDGQGPLHPLRSLTPGGENYAVDFNLWGMIVGNATNDDGNNHATRWFLGGVQDLHGRFPGFDNSFATGVSLTNDVVVSAYDPDFAVTAFLLKGGSTINLSQAAGSQQSEGYDISDRDWVAGGAGEDGVFTAGVWLPGSQHWPFAVAAKSGAKTRASATITRAHARMLQRSRVR